MTPNEKKAQALRMLAEINSPAALNHIYRFVYRQFLKTVDQPMQRDYFSLSVKLPADVPEKNLPDLYSIIRGLASPQQ